MIGKAKIQKYENEIIKLTKELKNKELDVSLFNAALEIFKSTQGAALRIGSPKREFVSQDTFAKLSTASTIENVQDAEGSFLKETLSDSLRRQELQLELDNLNELSMESLNEFEKETLNKLKMERTILQQNSVKIKSEFNVMKQSAINKIKLGELLKKTHPSLSMKELELIITEKRTFDIAIKNLALKENISFDLRK